VALLLAGQRDDVVSVQTHAGNIAVTAWAQLQGLTPLNGSLDPVNYANKLRTIPQRHLVPVPCRDHPASVGGRGPSLCGEGQTTTRGLALGG